MNIESLDFCQGITKIEHEHEHRLAMLCISYMTREVYCVIDIITHSFSLSSRNSKKKKGKEEEFVCEFDKKGPRGKGHFI